MQEHERKALSQARLEHAVECLSAARNFLETGNYESAANRSYYAVFHAMRAVLAFDEIDMKRHSGVISEFRRRYIKAEIFETRMSRSDGQRLRRFLCDLQSRYGCTDRERGILCFKRSGIFEK